MAVKIFGWQLQPWWVGIVWVAVLAMVGEDICLAVSARGGVRIFGWQF